MSKTKAELVAELQRIRNTWTAPELYEEALIERDNAREQLQTVKAARDHLETSHKILQQQTAEIRERARRGRDELAALEIALEKLIPPEFLGEEWDSLITPLTNYIQHLQRTTNLTVPTVVPTETISIPLMIEIKVQRG